MIQKLHEEGEKTPVHDADHLFIINNPVMKNKWSVYLPGEVPAQEEYTVLLNYLRSADPSDQFLFYISNFGGYLQTANDLINAMKACPAPIAMTVTGPIYSAAPLIALQADILYLEENVFFMFHDYSGGEQGKGSEMIKSITHYQDYFRDFFITQTNEFLTEKEQQDILDGKDLYLNRKQCMKRLKKMGKLFDANPKITTK